MRSLLLLFILLVSIPIHAQILDQSNCKDTDIRETNPRIRNSPEMIEHFSSPRNQDSIGWCYAFSAADLMSAEVGKPISAIHASTIYNRKIQKNLILRLGYRIGKIFQKGYLNNVYEGGFASWTLKEMMKSQNICLEEDLPFDQNYNYETLSMIRQLEELKESVNAKKILQENLCREIEYILPYPKLISFNTEEIAASLLNDNMNITMEKISQQVCKDSMIAVPKMKVISKRVPGQRNLKKSKKFLKNMNKVLESGRPVEFSYNTKHFCIMDGKHSSIVMGRRWNNGRCEYQVRNSWGQSCASYNDNVDCDYYSGTFWVSDKDFIKASGRINYLSPK